MHGCPVIRISPWIALCLFFAGACPVFAQIRLIHTEEPPLADPDNPIQLVGAQSPTTNAAGTNSVGVPVVLVNVIAPSHVPFNEPMTYRLRVENTSNYTALEVRLFHPLNGAKLEKAEPKQTSGETELEWTIGTLKGGEHREFKVTIVPKADTREFEAIAKVRFDHGRKASIKISRPEVSLSLNVPKDVQQFDVVPARLEVRNAGPMEVKDIQVTIALPEGVAHQYDPNPANQTADPKNSTKMRTWTVARLGPHEVRSLDFRFVGSQTGPANLEVLAVPSNGPRTDAKSVVTVQPPRLELTASGPIQRSTHQPAVYRIAVKNAGTFVMRNVKVTNQLPAQTEFVTASDGGQLFDRQVQWMVPVVNPGETRVIELTVKHTAGGSVTHQFEAVYRKAVQQASVTTAFENTAAVRVDFRGSPETIDVGATVRYVLTIENTGSAAATNVRAVVALPDSLAVISTEPHTDSHDGGRVAFNSSTVASGGRLTFTVTARAQRPANAAIVTAELNATELEAGALRRQETTAIISGNRP